MYQRNVPAMDTKTTPPIWKLTNYQWAVYYWLLAHSKRNPNNQEKHYYIYRNSFTLKQIRNQTGVKTDPTIRTAFIKLKECGALIEDESINAFLLLPPPLFIPMDASIILSLLAFNKYLDPGLVITTFAILARLDRVSKNGPRPSFTKSELAMLLGFAKQHTDDIGVVLILALLSHLKLIELQTATYTNRLGVECIRYTLMSARPDLDLSIYVTEDDEVDEGRIHALWQAICAEVND